MVLKIYGPWVAGTFLEVSSRNLVTLKEPASEVDLAKLAISNNDDIDKALSSARMALTGPWSRMSANERARLLHLVADLIEKRREEFAELETRNVGKAISSVNAEISGAIETLRFFGSVTASNNGHATSIGSSLLTYSLKEPIGVCAQIVPWNYPLLMTVWKLAPALAAGCTIVLKPDIKTPISALLLAELIHEAGFPSGVLNVVPGDGKIGAYLVAHPGVDKVSFTGSTATGSEVMRLASSPIKPITLELGGKSPNIIFADADLSDAIPSSCWSIFYAAGQSCEARSRILIQKSIYDDFVTSYVEAAKKIRVGDPLDPNTQMGSLISNDHRNRVHGYVERSASKGAKVLLGGFMSASPGAFYNPTVIASVEPGSEIEQEEVFGPVVTLQSFENEDDAIVLANSTSFGLFATIWSQDSARLHRMARKLQSGMIGLNTPYAAFPGIGFGGYKQSGFGRELSSETLLEYTQTKSIILSTGNRQFNPFKL